MVLETYRKPVKDDTDLHVGGERKIQRFSPFLGSSAMSRKNVLIY